LNRLVRLLGAAIVLVVVAAGGWWLTGAGVAASPPASSTDDGTDEAASQTVAVERRTLTVTDDFDATLRFAGDYDAAGPLRPANGCTRPMAGSRRA